EAGDSRRGGVEGLDVAIARRVDRRGRDRRDAGDEDDDRRQQRHANEELVPERLAPLAHADRAHERRPGRTHREDGGGHSIGSTTFKLASSRCAFPSVTKATPAPPSAGGFTGGGFVGSGFSWATTVGPFSGCPSRNPATACTRTRSS